MVQVSYPGVYIQEVPSGVHTITGVSTSVAAFIGFFREGPMDTPVQIFGMSDFTRIFGGLDDRSEASYAINQFFANGGSEAFVVRVSNSSTAAAAASVVVEDLPGAGGASVFRATAKSPGIWGDNLRLYVDHNSNDADNAFNLTVSRHASQDDLAPVVATEKYLNLTVNPNDPRYFVSVVNEESALIEVEHLNMNADPAMNVLPASNGTYGIAITATIDGTWNNSDFNVAIGGSGPQLATMSWPGTTPDPTNLVQLRPHVEAAIRSAVPTNPAFSGATVEIVGGNRLLVKAGRTDPNYATTSQVAITAGGGTASADLGFTGAGTGQTQNIQEYTFDDADANTRAQGAVVAGADGIEPDALAINGDPSAKTGLYALEDVDLFNILCIPRSADLAATEMTAVISEALTYCERRRAFMIIDPPETVNSVQEIKDWLDDNNGFRSTNSALYFPRLSIPDPVNEFRLRSIGASGTMAGLYARTDSTRGVWKAPAGTEASVRGVSKLDVKLTDAENGTLNPLAINCVRNFPVYGPVSWGARTLDGSDQAGSEWKYIPIRRFALFLEESLFRGTKWVVFEPNDEPLWAQIRMNLNAFMMTLFRQGAFQGDTPDKAFYVKCDSETTTQADRNLGIVNIEVGFAPLKPAEFVIIKFQQIAGDL